MKQAIILAGGKGTRLRSVLGDIPKPLAMVGDTPLLGHQLNLLREHGFNDVLLLVNHGADAIGDWINSQDYGDLNVRLIDDGEPRGTAGAVLAVLPHLAEHFLVLYADTMIGVDLSRFWSWHASDPETSASLFLHPNDHPADSDLVEVDDVGRILRFYPYPHPNGEWLPNLVNAALYVIRREALARWQDAAFPLDFAKNLFPRMLEAGLLLRGYNSPEYIKDAGTPARLERVRRHFASGVVARASLTHKQRAVFIDRDGTLNDDSGHIARAENLHVFPFVGPALHRLNEAEWRAVVVTNQPVLARGEASDKDMRRIHARLDSDVARDHAFFDRLYLCPHHPDRGFAGEVAHLKIDCACRKPKAGLIHRAAQDLNIDLAESWFIGDSTADLGAAENAKVSSILVRTGSAGLDDKYPYEVGFSQPDFSRAVDFILDTYPRIAAACAPTVSGLAAGQDLFVGGLARSGKSTVAATLARELRRSGHDAVVVQLDRWIFDEADRSPGVLGRFDFASIESVFAQAAARGGSGLEGLQLKLPAYSRRTKKRTDGQYELSLAPATIVIWEGVVALELAGRLNKMELTLAVRGSENGRKGRFHEYDSYRGIGAASSSLSWNAREQDEHPFVTKQILSAQRSIFLDEVLS